MIKIKFLLSIISIILIYNTSFSSELRLQKPLKYDMWRTKITVDDKGMANFFRCASNSQIQNFKEVCIPYQNSEGTILPAIELAQLYLTGENSKEDLLGKAIGKITLTCLGSFAYFLIPVRGIAEGLGLAALAAGTCGDQYYQEMDELQISEIIDKIISNPIEMQYTKNYAEHIQVIKKFTKAIEKIIY